MHPPANILIVEDEPAIADTLLYALRTEGFAPRWCATARDALAELAARPFALVILDIGLPDANGFDLCKQIRQRAPDLPVLFLTARNSEIDRIVGLEIGGDDYVTKPFSPREVSARVKAILRRVAPPVSAKHERTPIKTQAFTHDPDKHEIRYNATPLDLTRYEYRLLKTLLSRPNRVFSRDELMTQAWEDPGASLDRTVDAHIKTLRAKLRAASPDADPIQTHRGMGYSLREEQAL